MSILTIFGEAFGRAGGFSDFFESMFGGRRGARAGSSSRMRGQDIEAEIDLTAGTGASRPDADDKLPGE